MTSSDPNTLANVDSRGTPGSARSAIAWLVGSPAGRAWCAFALLFAGIAYLRIGYMETVRFLEGIDGGYYTDIAQHVRDGNGLVTDVSIFHQGYAYFPHPTAIYPIWPLLYGYVSRVWPIELVGIWLPTALYFTSLLCGYLWAQRTFPGEFFPRLMPGIGAGHVLLVMLGLQFQFVKYTARPYTEGISFTLLFLALTRIQSRFKRPSAAGGLEVGAWLAVLFLARSQFLFVVVGAFGSLAWFAVFARETRLEFRKMAVACGVGFTVAMLPYVLYAIKVWGHFDPRTMLLFGETPKESPLSPNYAYRPAGDFSDALAARFKGMKLAFRWDHKRSYTRSFYAFTYALPLATVVAGITLAFDRPRSLLRRCWAWLRDARNADMIMLLLMSLLGLAMLHWLIKGNGQWYFHRRHNLSAFFAFLLPLVYLLRHRWAAVRVVGLLLFLVGTYGSVTATAGATASRAAHPPKLVYKDLSKWLRKEHEKRGDFTVAFTGSAQHLGWQTPGISYHWMYPRTTLRDLDIMFDKLGADLLVVERVKRRKPWKFNRPAKAFAARYVEVYPDAFKRYQFFERRPSEPAPAAVSPTPVPRTPKEKP
jgi:hypothetical protein